MIETRVSIRERATARAFTARRGSGTSVYLSSPRPLPHTQARTRASSRVTKPHVLALSLLLVGVTLGMLGSLLFMASDCQPAKMMDTMHALAASVSWHCLLIGGIGIVALGVSTGGVLVGLAFAVVETLIHPQTKEPFIPYTPFSLDLPAEEVSFPARYGGHKVRGIYCARPDATTTIILSPGYRRGCADVLAMSKHLWAAGHNVLAFEYYGHGRVVGVPVTPGYREVEDFLGAVSYARQRAPETRIGALGYSMGGAVSIMGSTQTPEVEAVVADSAFASSWNAVEQAILRTLHLPPDSFPTVMRLLRRLTDIVLAARAGYHFHQVEPWRVISRLAPRPVLLIHGLNDTVVHPGDSVQVYEAAGKPKALWHIPGAEHGKAYVTDPQTYISRVVTFFDSYLKLSASAMPGQEQDHVRADKVSNDSSLSDGEQIVPLPSAPLADKAARSKVPSQTEIEEMLVQIIAHVFAVPKERLDCTSDIFEYGGDSQTLGALLTRIEEQFHVRVSADEIWDHSMVHALATRIIQKQKGRGEG